MGPGVQRQYAPNSICFGCGPANEKGLQIDSHRCSEGLELRFTPSDEHQAFPGMVNGGIIGSLLDCHGNWAAAIALMDQLGLDEPPVLSQRPIRSHSEDQHQLELNYTFWLRSRSCLKTERK